MKKAVTLVEILLAIVLSALLMGVVIPFIRSMSLTLETGSGRQEILQNSRASLEVMTRYLRQASRITQIPGSSGNYIKIRSREDTYNIIFYHNVSGSPYYIGASGIIKDGDIVMRSDQTGSVDSLLAPSAESLTFNFLQDNRTPATKANQVKSIQINAVLADPLARISNTLSLSDSVTLRQDIKILSATPWFCHDNQIGELSSDAWIGGFSTPNAVSVNNVLLVNGKETVWVADTSGNRIRRIYWNGTAWTYDTISGFSSPRSVSVNPAELVNGRETCWVADTSGNRIRRIVWTGSAWSYSAGGGVNITGFSGPRSVSVNPNEAINGRNTCWVADTGGNRVRKIYWNGSAYTYTNLSMGTGSSPRSVSVNTADNTCWVANSGTNPSNGRRVRKLRADNAAILLNVTGFSTPYSVSVNTSSGECWAADTGNNLIKKISSGGAVLESEAGFNQPQFVSVDSAAGDCWVADTGNNKIKKLNSEGDIEFDITGFSAPLCVSLGA